MMFRKRDNDRFDPRAAYESDRSSVLKSVLLALFGIIIIAILIYIGYGTYQRMSANQNQTDINATVIGNQSNDTSPGEFAPQVNVTFEGKNFTVNQSSDGIYFFTTKDKVIEERCYADDRKISCKSMTEKYCRDKDCEKEVLTVKECFVNNEKVTCPQ